jgi:hypothetical protein
MSLAIYGLGTAELCVDESRRSTQRNSSEAHHYHTPGSPDSKHPTLQLCGYLAAEAERRQAK